MQAVGSIDGAAAPVMAANGSAGRTLAGACIGMLFNPSPIVLLSFGVFLLPIVHDTGWNRNLIAGSIGVAMLAIGLSPPLVGWLVNRYGPKRVSRIGFPLFGLAIMLLATPRSAAMFVVTLGVFGLLAATQTSILYIYCISGWFDRRRGTALGVGMASTGLGIATIPPLAARLIESIGWRETYIVLGLAVLVVSVPVTRWLVFDPPAIVARSTSDIPGVTLRRALRMRVFWLLFGSIFLVAAAASAGAVNLNILLIERDVPAARASFALTALGLSAIVARLVFGALLDRARGQTLTAIICAMVGVAFLVLAGRGDVGSVMVAAVLIGIGFGAEGDALSYLSSRAFGMRDFGVIFGVIFLAFTTGGAIGPILFALSHAHFGTYQPALWAAGAACAVATAAILSIRDADLPFAGRPRRAPADTVLVPAST